MTLSEYYSQFLEYIGVESTQCFTTHVAAEVAAAHHIGLNHEQLKQFLARRTEITSVACALKGELLSVEKIERILAARESGAIKPKEILSLAFAKEEIHEKYVDEIGTQEAGNA